MGLIRDFGPEKSLVLASAVVITAATAPDMTSVQEGPAGKGSDSSRQGLLETIQGLQRALERSRKECQAAVSNAKYMQVCSSCLLLPRLRVILGGRGGWGSGKGVNGQGTETKGKGEWLLRRGSQGNGGQGGGEHALQPDAHSSLLGSAGALKLM